MSAKWHDMRYIYIRWHVEANLQNSHSLYTDTTRTTHSHHIDTTLNYDVTYFGLVVPSAECVHNIKQNRS